MTIDGPEVQSGRCRHKLRGAIFDVDGVLLASPHERAWREAIEGFADPASFTSSLYEAQVAGKPRLAGAVAALEALGVPNATELAAIYAERKQKRLEDLIEAGCVSAFPDALRFVEAITVLGLSMAAASSSKNVNGMMKTIRLGSGKSLFDAFGVNVCGRDLPRGKPDPAIFLLAANELKMEAASCFVTEDAPAGIRAARSGGMTALGVARKGDAALLWRAGADRVVTSLDEVVIDDIAAGRLSRKVS